MRKLTLEEIQSFYFNGCLFCQSILFIGPPSRLECAACGAKYQLIGLIRLTPEIQLLNGPTLPPHPEGAIAMLKQIRQAQLEMRMVKPDPEV